MDGFALRQILHKTMSQLNLQQADEVVNWIVQFVFAKSSDFHKMDVYRFTEMLEIEDLR